MTTMPQTDQVTVTIDGVDVDVPKGTLLVEAAKQIHRDIPVYCYHPKLGPAGSVPHLPGRDRGDAEAADRLQHAGRRQDGRAHAERQGARKAGARCSNCCCSTTRWIVRFATRAASAICKTTRWPTVRAPRAWPMPKSSKPKAVDLGPTIVLDEERCVLCLRCVRFDDIITGERSLRTDDRGAHAIIATATGEPYDSDFSGNVTELCPVGALTSKTYRFKSRPWDNHRTTTTCMQCSVGCQMHVDARVRRGAAHDERRRRRRDLRRLAVRPRPLQHRLPHRRAPAHAAALPPRRRVGADRLGRRDRAVGRPRCARGSRRAARRRSARSAAAGC